MLNNVVVLETDPSVLLLTVELPAQDWFKDLANLTSAGSKQLLPNGSAWL